MTLYHDEPHFYMFVGLPGSGKSTFRKNLIHKHVKDERRTVTVSTDDYIEAHAESGSATYNEVFQEHIKDATKKLNIDVDNALMNENNLIWDQTNLTKKVRKKKLVRIPKNYVKVAVFFDISEDTILNINTERKKHGRSIPLKTLQSMIDSIEAPQLDEGFDMIFKIER